jgi:uncharacterized protein YggE
MPRDPAPAAAQTDQNAPKPSTITVIGTGSVNVKPDILRITVGVSSQKDTVLDAQAEVDSALQAIYARLKDAGIAETDYRTAQYTVEPVMNYNDPKVSQGTLTGFRVVNMIEITFRDINAAPAILDGLVKAGANTIYGTNFAVNDPDSLGERAHEEAVKDAQKRAERLAALSNMTLGKIVSVSEANNGPYAVYGKDMGMGAGGASFAPGTQAIQTTLVVTYEATPIK